MQPSEHLGSHRLQARDDESKVESAIQIARVIQLSGEQCVIEVRERQARGFRIESQRAPDGLYFATSAPSRSMKRPYPVGSEASKPSAASATSSLRLSRRRFSVSALTSGVSA